MGSSAKGLHDLAAEDVRCPKVRSEVGCEPVPIRKAIESFEAARILPLGTPEMIEPGFKRTDERDLILVVGEFGEQLLGFVLDAPLALRGLLRHLQPALRRLCRTLLDVSFTEEPEDGCCNPLQQRLTAVRSGNERDGVIIHDEQVGSGACEEVENLSLEIRV